MTEHDDDRAYDGEAFEDRPQEEPPQDGRETEQPDESFEVRGEDLIATIKELVREGNIRRIIIENEKGETFVEIPLTIGVVGAVLLPVWAAIGAIAAVATRCTIKVERRGEPGDE
jgi:hypothetical protein